MFPHRWTTRGRRLDPDGPLEGARRVVDGDVVQVGEVLGPPSLGIWGQKKAITMGIKAKLSLITCVCDCLTGISPCPGNRRSARGSRCLTIHEWLPLSRHGLKRHPTSPASPSMILEMVMSCGGGFGITSRQTGQTGCALAVNCCTQTGQVQCSLRQV